MSVIGWDIGGVNTKAAYVESGRVVAAVGEPFELQRAPARLPAVLGELAERTGAPGGSVHAVTMTAELSQMFRTKREGVGFVLDAVAAAFPGGAVHVYTTAHTFVDADAARSLPLAVGAANWAATAQLVAEEHRDILLIDIGTTTADLIPIVNGSVVAAGRTDLDRLASGELVYTGALRTPVEAILSHLSLDGRRIGVSAEGFALAGDAHVWRGALAPSDYSVPAPDGRSADREFAGERLARVVCADREMLDDARVSEIAEAVAQAQVARIGAAIGRIVERHPVIRAACVTGLGAFLAADAARSRGLAVVALSARLGGDGARYAPAAAVGLLLEAALAERGAAPPPRHTART